MRHDTEVDHPGLPGLQYAEPDRQQVRRFRGNPHDGQRSGDQSPDPAAPGGGDPDGVDPPGVRELLGRAGIVGRYLALAQPDPHRPATRIRVQQAQARQVRACSASSAWSREK